VVRGRKDVPTETGPRNRTSLLLETGSSSDASAEENGPSYGGNLRGKKDLCGLRRAASDPARLKVTMPGLCGEAVYPALA